MTDAAPSGGGTVGGLVSEVASDVTRLVRQEVALATREIRGEVAKAASAARLLTAGALVLYLFAVLASVSAALALGEVVTDRLPSLARYAPALGAAAVALAWLFIGLILLGVGRRRLRSVSPIPRRTIQTLKEDVAWLRRTTASAADGSRSKKAPGR